MYNRNEYLLVFCCPPPHQEQLDLLNLFQISQVSQCGKQEEADEHLFVYKTTGNLNMTVTDEDANGLPIGLEAFGITTAAGTGMLQVILRHQPDGEKGYRSAGQHRCGCYV